MRRSGERKMRETEVDGDAAALLLGQAVGIGAGEGADQRALAMVNMAGCPHDDGLHSEQFTEMTAAAPPVSEGWLWNFNGTGTE